MAVSISNLMLNFVPVTLSGQTSLTVGYRPYEKDTLIDLRAEFPQTHVFKRDGKENRIIEPGFPIWLWYLTARTSRRAVISGVPTQEEPTTEGDTLWVNYSTRRFSSRSMAF